MIIALKRSIVRPLALAIMLAMMICTIGISPVHAENLDVSITTERTADKNEILLDDTFLLNYSIEPQPIPCEVVAPNPAREIVLVIDTSGSMRWDIDGNETNDSSRKRMTIAKNAALKFIENIESHDNVKLSLVSYANIGYVEKKLTTNFNEVKSEISNLNADGGTNIGDGLRRAYYELNNGNAAEKYIILLTDGEPTYHSYKYVNKKKEAYFMESGAPYDFKGGGSKATPEDIEYCFKVVDELINTKDINTYMVAFTGGSNKNILESLANAAGGEYKAAKDSDALQKVYQNISQVVVSDHVVSNVIFEEVFPDGLEIVLDSEEQQNDDITVDGQKISIDLGSICYSYNNVTKQYEADPINFEIKLKGTAAGNYILGENKSSKLKYKDIDGVSCEEYFPEVQVAVIDPTPTPTPTPEPTATATPTPEPTPSPTPVPYGMPELNIVGISRTGETVKVELNAILPENTNNGKIVFITGEKDSIEANTTGNYEVSGLSIYQTYTVKLEATSNSGEFRETNPLTIFKAIDIN